MLVLTRRIGEALIIGADTTVTVLAVRGQHVQLGVNAPKSIPVHREEIANRIRAAGGGRDGLAASGPAGFPPAK